MDAGPMETRPVRVDRWLTAKPRCNKCLAIARRAALTHPFKLDGPGSIEKSTTASTTETAV
jgi:hypothetical protein